MSARWSTASKPICVPIRRAGPEHSAIVIPGAAASQFWSAAAARKNVVFDNYERANLTENVLTPHDPWS
jgi:hypothetical protein